MTRSVESCPNHQPRTPQSQCRDGIHQKRVDDDEDSWISALVARREAARQVVAAILSPCAIAHIRCNLINLLLDNLACVQIGDWFTADRMRLYLRAMDIQAITNSNGDDGARVLWKRMPLGWGARSAAMVHAIESAAGNFADSAARCSVFSGRQVSSSDCDPRIRATANFSSDSFADQDSSNGVEQAAPTTKRGADVLRFNAPAFRAHVSQMRAGSSVSSPNTTAAVCSGEDQIAISFAGIVNAALGKQLNKTQQRSNWDRRCVQRLS